MTAIYRHSRRFVRWGGTILLLGTCLSQAAITPELHTLLQSRKVQLPFYENWNAPPAGVIKVDRFALSHRRQGFFRIGALPVLLADRVVIEALGTNEITGMLRRTAAWSRFPEIRGVELRQIEIIEPGRTIKAAHGEVRRDRIVLSDATVDSGGDTRHFVEVVLQLGTHGRGELTFKDKK